MSDILDYIREQLSDHPSSLVTIDPILMNARHIFGGDTIYVRKISTRDLLPGSVRDIATRNNVSCRTVQRWQKET